MRSPRDVRLSEAVSAHRDISTCVLRWHDAGDSLEAPVTHVRRKLPTMVVAALLTVPVIAQQPAVAQQPASTPAAPARQPESIGFSSVREHKIVVEPFTDGRIDELLAILDGLLARQPDPAKWAKDTDIHFWRLMNRLQTGLLGPAQEAKVLAHFDAIEKAHPSDKEFIDAQRRTVRTQMIGKVAPEIVGKDYDGAEFKLSDYRGKVTVLYFTGQWCGPCRGEYPYERLMLEVHKDKPFAIVGVNSDDKLETARKAKIDNKLDYRSWWDGYVEKKSTNGPIASAWHVTGWPAIYVLDANGVIRFVNLRQEDVLKGVSQLVQEQATLKK
jgi:peroxiredoxin